MTSIDQVSPRNAFGHRASLARAVPLVLALLIVSTVAVAWFFRWQVIPVASAEYGRVYMLNRWTGAVYLVQGDSRYKVPDLD
jgi:hypothetical protein